MASQRPHKLIVLIFGLGLWLLPFISASLLFQPVLAQGQRAYSIPGNRITAIEDGADKRSLVIRLENQSVADRPVFRYVPAEGGDTILTADFPGLAWNSPTRIIRLNSSEKGFRSEGLKSDGSRSEGSRSEGTVGIKEVRVSQFADSPAVMRVSFVARDAHLLKNVAIAAGPGVLKITWGAAKPADRPRPVERVQPAETATSSDYPPLAPAIAKNASLNAPAVKPAALPSSARQAFRDLAQGSPAEVAAATSTSKDQSSPVKDMTAEPRQRLSREFAPAAVHAASDGAVSGGAGGAGSAANSGEIGAAPTISLVPCDSLGAGVTMEIFRLEMPYGQALSFKSFRLHNPERYVIDLPDCPALSRAEVPDVHKSALVSSLRVGSPDGSESTGRLVIQLADDQVNVQDKFTPGSNYLSITLGKGLMLGGDSAPTNEKFSSGEITPGPIVVPRAPDETVVVLDAGHGGSDPGAMRADVQEKDITLGIIEKLKKILESKGARIVLTRHDDTFVSLEDRVKITNQVAPNLFLSVHINSLETTSNIYGIETYFQTELSRPLAERVHASLVAGLAAPDRNIRRARFYVINHTPVPAILAEVGYITNKAERDRLISSDYQEKVASALARGVMLYLQDTGVAAGQLANSGRNQAGRTAH